MIESITWRPGGLRNKPYEVANGIRGDYEFSLCNRQEDSDASLFRLFVYRHWTKGGGFKSLGGFDSMDEAMRAAHLWQDDQPSSGCDI